MKRTWCVLACIALASCATGAGALQYSIRDLGAISGYNYYIANGVNNSGQVVGWMLTPDRVGAAFVWDATSGLRAIGEEDAVGRGINNSGVALLARGGGGTPTLWDSVNGCRTIDAMTGHCINELGHVAGGCWIWDQVNGSRTISCLPGDDTCYAYAINNLDQVVGESKQYVLQQPHGFIWDSVNGSRDIGCLSGYYNCYARGINDSSESLQVMHLEA